MQTKEKQFQVTALMLILILGGSLRLYGLKIQSLWNDELSSWRRSGFSSLTEVIDLGVRPDVHPPGYQIILFYVERYMGDSETILRLPSAIAGIVSILIIFLIGKQLYSYKEGLIAATLLAILQAPIFYSQEARAYSLLMLTTLLAAYFWIAIITHLKKETKIPLYLTLAYIFTGIFASYLHYYGLFFIGLQGIGIVFFAPRKRQTFFYIFAVYTVILLVYLPWIPTMVAQFSGESVGHIQKPRYTALLDYLFFLFNYSKELLLLILALYGFLLFSSLYKYWKTKTDDIKSTNFSADLLLILWLFVPFIIVFLISIASQPILTNRNLIISLPAAYLLVARAITQLPVKRVGQIIVVLFIMSLFLFQLVFVQDYYSTPHKEQFREAVGYVVNEAHSYENAVTIGYVWYPEYLNYYFQKEGATQRVNMIAGQEQDISDVDKYIQEENPDYIWYIAAHKEPSPEFIEFLDQKFKQVQHESFIKAEVWLFEN